MENLSKTTTIIVAIVIVAIAGLFALQTSSNESDQVKIGVITPLSGNSAYWGESTRAGMRLAQEELNKQGINVDFIFEDGKVKSEPALNAAQKLVNVDNVDAIYSEFNPAAISVSSFLEGQSIPHMISASVVSPLEGSPNTFKTYLDYRKSCQRAAEEVQSQGIEKIGVMKVSLEFGNLCLEGIKSVFGDNLVVESFSPGANDLRTQLSKLQRENVGAIINAAFKPDTILTLRQMNELGIDARFVALSETITPDVVDEYTQELESTIVFGLPQVSNSFVSKLENQQNRNVDDKQAAALGYMHAKQLANALNSCGDDNACVQEELSSAEPNDIIGFRGFENRIAVFDTFVREFKDGEFVDLGGE